MNPVPKNPEFDRFTETMRSIVKVSKMELDRRIETEKRIPKGRASRASDGPSKRA